MSAIESDWKSPNHLTLKEPKHHALTTLGVSTKAVPTGFTTFFSWFWGRRRRRKAGDPAAQLKYKEGLEIVARFLRYASQHTLNELQAFTANHVPSPSWVSVEVVQVSETAIQEAARLMIKHLSTDPRTLELVGGRTWWQSRGRPLTAEWIEMRKQKVKRGNNLPERVLLYVHGGAHFFSSLETHRYQIQRWARKLGARAFAPSYRLAPQYPFPCSLQDTLACYLVLLDSGFKPSQILVGGDSSGAGLTLSLLCLLRDLSLPLPAGAILISPWVDLAHSFPSISNDTPEKDYIPNVGFHYRPSVAWPPPSLQDPSPVTLIGETEPVVLSEQMQLYTTNALLNHPLVSPVNQGSLGGLCPLYINCGDAELLRDEIIHVAHKAADSAKYPPAQSTLEAYPSQRKALERNYPPTLVQLQVFDGACHVATTLSITKVAKYMFRGGTNFGLWALAAAEKSEARRAQADGNESHHTQHHHHHHHYHGHDHHRQTSSRDEPSRSSTLNSAPSGTQTPASNHSHSSSPHVITAVNSQEALAANFEMQDLSDQSDSDSDCSTEGGTDNDDIFSGSVNNGVVDPSLAVPATVKVTGQLPRFRAHMIRERVSWTGQIRALEPAERLAGCTIPSDEIGQLHSQPVRKWLASRAAHDVKFAKDLTHWRQARQADMALARTDGGHLLGQFKDETPPVTSVTAWNDEKMALRVAESVDRPGLETNLALDLWTKISAAPDEEVMNDSSNSGKEDVAEGKGGDPA